MALTFSLVTLAWIFFRANTLSDALHYLSLLNFNIGTERTPMLYVLLLAMCDWVISHRLHLRFHQYTVARYATYTLLLFFIIYHTGINDAANQFIYFNF